MTFYTSNKLSHSTESEHNKDLTQRLHIDARTWKFSQNYLGIFPKFHRVQNWLYACKSCCKCTFQFQCSVSYHWIFTKITYMDNWNKFLEHVSTFIFNSLNSLCKLAPSAHIRYFCKYSMIAHAALVLKDTFAPRFASGAVSLMYKMSLVHIRIKPRQAFQSVHRKLYKGLNGNTTGEQRPDKALLSLVLMRYKIKW